MTKIVFTKKGEDFVRIESRGHAGYSEKGSDVVCAGISALLQGAALGVLKVAGVKARYEINEKEGALLLALPKEMTETERRDCQVILRTLYESVSDLRDGYSGFISVEVK